jgi:hypothetical protein
MFEEFMGYLRLEKKWAKLLNLVRSDDEENMLTAVAVVNDYIIAMDGGQAVRIEKNKDIELADGYYVLADRLMVAIPDERAVGYPDISSKLERSQFTKTADISIGEHPLVAISQAIKEFNVIIDIDRFQEVLAVLSNLNPVYARIYGFADPAVAKVNGVKIEMLIDYGGTNPVIVEYLAMPLKSEAERFIKVDEQPRLFDLKKGV